MKIIRIEADGLGHQDVAVDLPMVAVVTGPNESGKSSIIAALQLGVTGRISGAPGVELAQTLAGVMSYARGDELIVRLGVETDAGLRWIARRVARDKDGSISGALDQQLGPGSGVREGQRAIDQALATRPEVWSPWALLSARPTDLRRTLLGALPAQMRLDELVPRDAPAWGRAERTDDPYSWIRRVRAAAQVRLTEARGAVLAAADAVEDADGAWDEPEPEGPVEARILELGTALEAYRERAALEGSLATARATLSRLEGQRDAASDRCSGLPALEAELSLLQAQLARASERTLHAERERVATEEIARLEGLRAEAEPPPPREWDAEDRRLVDTVEAVLVQERRQEARLRAERAVDAATANRDAVARARPTACVLCGGVDPGALAEWEGVLAAAEALLERERVALGALPTPEIVDGALDVARSTLLAHRASREAWDRAVRHAWELDAALLEARGRRRASGEALAALGDLGPTPARAAERVRELSDHVRELTVLLGVSSALGRQAGQQHVAVRALEARLAALALPAEPQEQIEAALAAAKADLAALRERNAARRSRAEAAAAHERAERDLAELAAWSTRFRDLEVALAERTIAPLLVPLSRLCGAPVTLDLADERGRPDCAWRLDGVPVEAISDGQRVRFLASLVAALLRVDTSVRWRPLVIDRLEAISVDQRGAFVARVADLVRLGWFDQAILLGCPDSDAGLPPDTIRLGGGT